MTKRQQKLTADDVPRILQTLACGDETTQRHMLRLLCPCRNRLYNEEVWVAICRVYENEQNPEGMRDQAKHALDTLRDRARTDPDSHDLLDALAQRGFLLLPQKLPPACEREDRVTSREVPGLLEILACDDLDAQKDALRLLCPCRNRRYDKEVWRAIFDAYQTALDAGVRDQALHAIETLRQRARTDPRSQDLLRWLAAQDIGMPGLEQAIPVWRPLGRIGPCGLTIPHWQHSPRSKANRRR
ncbi:MAG TPA: hypothetical protein VKT32_06870 [Chthonomonadaceae bacterium]|nr:hypothetical protein [Chthonomonadaceae bacterium]